MAEIKKKQIKVSKVNVNDCRHHLTPKIQEQIDIVT